MEELLLKEEVDQGQSKQMYEDSLAVLDELYKTGFDGVEFTAEDAYMLQRLQHNITSNMFWRMTMGDEFPEDLLFYRMRIATQAIFLLGRRSALRQAGEAPDEN